MNIDKQGIMKKSLLTIACCLLTAACCLLPGKAFAQGEVGSVSFVPQVGISYANLSDASNGSAKLGFTAGIEAKYQISDMFAVSGGVFYTQQGAKGTENFSELGVGNVAVDIDLANDYLNIPVLLNAYVAKGFAIKAGVQPSILMSAKAKGKASNGQKDSITIKDYFNTFDVAIPLGISYETEDGFIIDARYNLGLLDVIKNNVDKACRNCVAQITLGYKF